MHHAVVVQVSAAESATILLSNEAGAGMEFEVAADAPVNAQLAKLDAGVSLFYSMASASRSSVRLLTPLFKLAPSGGEHPRRSQDRVREALVPGADNARRPRRRR